MEVTASLKLIKLHLNDSENMRKKILWSDDSKLNSLGRIPIAMSGEHRPLLRACEYHPYHHAMGSFLASGIGRLVRVEGRGNANKVREVLEGNLFLSA